MYKFKELHELSSFLVFFKEIIRTQTLIFNSTDEIEETLVNIRNEIKNNITSHVL